MNNEESTVECKTEENVIDDMLVSNIFQGIMPSKGEGKHPRRVHHILAKLASIGMVVVKADSIPIVNKSTMTKTEIEQTFTSMATANIMTNLAEALPDQLDGIYATLNYLRKKGFRIDKAGKKTEVIASKVIAPELDLSVERRVDKVLSNPELQKLLSVAQTSSTITRKGGTVNYTLDHNQLISLLETVTTSL